MYQIFLPTERQKGSAKQEGFFPHFFFVRSEDAMFLTLAKSLKQLEIITAASEKLPVDYSQMAKFIGLTNLFAL